MAIVSTRIQPNAITIYIVETVSIRYNSARSTIIGTLPLSHADGVDSHIVFCRRTTVAPAASRKIIAGNTFNFTVCDYRRRRRRRRQSFLSHNDLWWRLFRRIQWKSEKVSFFILKLNEVLISMNYELFYFYSPWNDSGNGTRL